MVSQPRTQNLIVWQPNQAHIRSFDHSRHVACAKEVDQINSKIRFETELWPSIVFPETSCGIKQDLITTGCFVAGLDHWKVRLKVYSSWNLTGRVTRCYKRIRACFQSSDRAIGISGVVAQKAAAPVFIDAIVKWWLHLDKVSSEWCLFSLFCPVLSCSVLFCSFCIYFVLFVLLCFICVCLGVQTRDCVGFQSWFTAAWVFWMSR